MPLVLTNQVKDADKEDVVYWLKPESSRSWPVNGDGVPLMDNGEPFPMTEDEHIALPIARMTSDPQEGEEIEPGANMDDLDVYEPSEVPVRVGVTIRILSGKEISEINNAMIKTRSHSRRGRRGRRDMAVETDIDVGVAVAMKLEAGIIAWDGIVDEKGNPAPITKPYIDLLPSWMQSDLTDRITALSELDEDLAGES